MVTHINRRNFARLLGLSAGAVTLPSAAVTPSPVHERTPTLREFPDGFLWGTATSAYQIEGATEEEGRGPSIGDPFSRVRKNTYTGDSGDIADDHFHRYREDIGIMRDLGVKSYQFSL